MAMSPTLMVATTGVMAANDSNERSVRDGRPAHSPLAAAFARGHATHVGVPVRLTYVQTPALRKQVQDGFLQRLRSKDPASAPQVADQLAKYDYSRIYADLVRSYGLHTDDAADAVAAYALLGWGICNSSDAPPAVVQAMRNRIAVALAANPTLSGQRAALGEEMKILFVVVQSGWQTAKRDGTLPAFTSQMAGVFRQQTGVDLRGRAPRRLEARL